MYYIGKLNPSQTDAITYHMILGPFSGMEVERESGEYTKAGVHHHVLNAQKVALSDEESAELIKTVYGV